jgi:hypothetical protein
MKSGIEKHTEEDKKVRMAFTRAINCVWEDLNHHQASTQGLPDLGAPPRATA